MEIAPSYTVDDWTSLHLDPANPEHNDWKTAVQILDKRFSRFFKPVDMLIEAEKQRGDEKPTFGFAILAIDFLVIETIQAFRKGIYDHTNESEKLIRNFLQSWPAFISNSNNHGADSKRVYKSYRCALLHSGGTDFDCRIKVSGETFDFKTKDIMSINRKKFHRLLKLELATYLEQLTEEGQFELRENCIKKMNHICGD